jgi:hypothetical protein
MLGHEESILGVGLDDSGVWRGMYAVEWLMVWYVRRWKCGTLAGGFSPNTVSRVPPVEVVKPSGKR